MQMAQLPQQAAVTTEYGVVLVRVPLDLVEALRTHLLAVGYSLTL